MLLDETAGTRHPALQTPQPCACLLKHTELCGCGVLIRRPFAGLNASPDPEQPTEDDVFPPSARR